MILDRNSGKYFNILKLPKSNYARPIILIICFVLLSALLLYLLYLNNITEQKNDALALSERISKNIEQKLKGNQDYIELLATERAEGNLSLISFQNRVHHYLKDHPEFINITWIDSNFIIKDVCPLANNAHIIGLQINLKEPKIAANKAKHLNKSIYTQPFEAIQSNSSFEIWVPVFKENAFLGLFAGVYSCEKILKQAIPIRVDYKLYVSLLDVNLNIEAESADVHHKGISAISDLASLNNGMKVQVVLLKVRAFSWVIMVLTALCFSLVLSLLYSLWKIRKESILREKIQSELEKQNDELIRFNTYIQNVNIELKIAKEKAEENERLKTAFLQNLSHEIRTPMNAIMGFTDLLVYNFNNKPNLERFSEIISQRCSDLLSIINDILDIAKIESGQVTVVKDSCNVSDLFRELYTYFDEYQKRFEKKHIEFEVQDSDLPSNIVTDKVKLKQILINLITNAFKFTEKGQISIKCKIDKSLVVFSVCDTGIGIPENKQNAIFERFTQVDTPLTKVVGGTGLGLSIVKGLVALLGGEIWLESKENTGTCFYFSIPYIKDCQPVLYVVIEPRVDSSQLLNKSILVVEDDPFNTAYISELLGGLGMNIVYVDNGTEAILKSQNNTFDLILMDIRLPDISGYQAAKEIIQYNPSAKIIAQTAFASVTDKNEAMSSGCIDFISKPYNREQMITVLSKHIMKPGSGNI